jgi:hypothetical protein
LYPPSAPGRAFNEAIPDWRVKHWQVLELGVGRKHPAGYVEEPEVVGVAGTAKETPLKVIL